MRSASIKEALQSASLQLREAETEAPRREALLLLAASLNRPLAYLYAHGDDLLSEEEVTFYQSWIDRRCCGEPYAYLCGEREFFGLPFYVTPACLIPRPETELLVEAAAQGLKDVSTPEILEVGTGSGAIAVTLAVLLPGARVTAVDVSASALAVAARNAARHRVGDRITFLQGDLYAPVAGKDFCFAAVVSNPPYIPSATLSALPRDVRDFEPRLALDGGPDGLHFYRRLTEELPTLFCKPTLLAFEVGQGQAEAVAYLCRGSGYEKVHVLEDLAGMQRVIFACFTSTFLRWK
ncbi:MAG: peptide chain release factor N(5)-glutamine methyltransferase [Dethiobacter sp.]|nr:peptide chain release factor N(5)-glutamine methyltransferase [Dethiobacter sp.]MCL5981864.1 peptide chain release factor N(5)-glutamine methyltransferase [Bacillota bacterium]